MADLQRAWNLYRQGNFQEALPLFQNSQSISGRAGHALTLLAMRRAEEAIATAENSLQRSPNVALQALLADLRGRLGKRSDAERELLMIVRSAPEAGYFHSLLGEQRIRLGKWEEGTNNFITALQHRDDQTFEHLKRVIADMVDAVTARRIPPEDALRFINRIDYSASDKSQGMNSFFARARRALNGRRRMKRDDLVEPWSISGPVEQSRPAQPPPAQHRQPPASPPQRAPAQPPAPSPRQHGGRDSPQKVRQAQRRRQRRQERQARRPEPLVPVREEPLARTLAATRGSMSRLMQQERRENECLQDLVAEMLPPVWPSELEVPIDTIPPLSASSSSILRGSDSITTANFRFTSGDIGVQITMERAMHNLIAAASAVKPTPLPLLRESIPRIELNLRDGLLEKMPKLDELYCEESEVNDEATLAVGKFIGECILQTYGGTWDHNIPAHESKLHLGDHRLDPIGLATRFLRSGDFDGVSLRSLIDEAEQAVDTSTSLPMLKAYLDPTSAMEAEALKILLADLWVNYRFSMPETLTPKIAASLILEEVDPAFVIARLPKQFLPEALFTNVEGGIDREGLASIAYLRRTGEFLMLASRKHFCRFLTATGKILDRNTAPAIAAYLDHHFRPGWRLVNDTKTAEALRRRIGNDQLRSPTLQRKGNDVGLAIQAVTPSGAVQVVRLRYRMDEDRSPFQLSIQ